MAEDHHITGELRQKPLFADVFVPDFRMGRDVVTEQVDAFPGTQVDHGRSVVAEPVEGAGEVFGFAHDDGSDLELADQAAAVPAGGERRHHDLVLVVSLAAGFAKGVGFAVDGGVAILHAAIVAAAEKPAVGIEQRGADRDPALGQALAGFADRNTQHLLMGHSSGILHCVRRRHFLTLTAGGALVYTLDRRPSVVHAQERRLRVPLRFFTRDEALAVAAAAAQIFPSDESGPGANEAGVVIYIDRQLAGPYGRDRYRYTQGPFESGVPELGYQGKETPAGIYRAGLEQIRGLHRRTPAEQRAALERIEGTIFFAMLRTHTIEGMFCDPMHGGNADLIGWQLIGFPGPRMSYSDQIEKYHGRAYRPKPASLRQIMGRDVKPSEDER